MGGDHILHIQAVGLAALLDFTSQEISFAALKIKGKQLQNILVYELSNYVCVSEKTNVSEKEEKKESN